MRLSLWPTFAYCMVALSGMNTCIHYLGNSPNSSLLKNGENGRKKALNERIIMHRRRPLFVKHRTKSITVTTIGKNGNRHKLRSGIYMENSNFDNNRLSLLKNLEDETKIITQSPDWNEKMPLIEIKNLHAIEVEGGKEILKGINLTVNLGEIHAIMGRNGSGKSTLAKVIAGHPYYKVTDGTMKFKGQDLNTLAVNVRSLCGIFLAFQYPVELPMVKNNEFLRAALNSHRRQKNEPELSASEFDLIMNEEIKKVGLSSEFLDRPVNYGFSGGEKKRNEILQMLILKPSFCILDETDSGLDVDSFKLTSNVIANFLNENNSFLIVTHYKKLLELLKPNFIHIMHQGKIIESGDYSLVDKIESRGYSQFVKD